MSTPDFFCARLDAMVDQRHPLVVLAGKLAWDRIEQALEPKFERSQGQAYTFYSASSRIRFGADRTRGIPGMGVSAARARQPDSARYRGMRRFCPGVSQIQTFRESGGHEEGSGLNLNPRGLR